MNKTSIAWTDYTFNPIRGCLEVSPGCTNCYAAELAARYDRGVMVGECEECHEPISAKSIYEGWANERRCAEHVLTAVFPK